MNRFQRFVLHPKRIIKKRSKLLRSTPQFSQIIQGSCCRNNSKSPFLCRHIRLSKTVPKSRDKKVLFRQRKTRHLLKVCIRQPCPASCRSGSGNRPLILTQPISCRISKRHMNNGINAVHVFMLFQSEATRLFSP